MIDRLLGQEYNNGYSRPGQHPHNNHNTTLSTHSSSQGSSWEEDRSVGGELEDSMVSRPSRGAHGGHAQNSTATTADLNVSAPSPSLHETHFDESDFDYPRTVLHHPDPSHNRRATHHHGQRPHPHHLHHQQHQQMPPNQQRPSSSADVCSSLQPGYWPAGGGRPTSAMDGRYSDTLRSRIQTPSDLLNTSVKSVFDCEQGCFVPSEEALLDETLDSNFTNDQSEYLLKNTSSNKSDNSNGHTSDPRDV